MPNLVTTSVSGKVLEEVQLTLDQLSEACGAHAEYIVELVEEGIVDPIDAHDSTWIFQGHCLKRVRTAMNLQQDLGINLAGIALALDLMQEVDDLRSELEKQADRLSS